MGFKAGDKVIAMSGPYKGTYGVVVCKDGGLIGVNTTYSPHRNLHTLGGRLKACTGLWMLRSSLKLRVVEVVNV